MCREFFVSRAAAFSAIFASILILSAFNLTVAMADPEPPLPDLTVSSVVVPQQVSTQQPIEFSWTVTNQGLAHTTAGWNDVVYISPDALLDISDHVIAVVHHPLEENLASQASYSRAAVRATVPSVPAGDYYVIVKTDADNTLTESNEDNNVAEPIRIRVPDLIVTSLTAPDDASAQEQIQVSWKVKNQGMGAAVSLGWTDVLFFSDDAVLDSSDAILQAWTHRAEDTLEAGASYATDNLTVTVPPRPAGTYFLILKTDRDEFAYESDENNNIAARPIGVKVPDLAVTTLITPMQLSTRDPAAVSWTVVNGGGGAALGFWYDTLYLSTDDRFDQFDTPLPLTSASVHHGPLAPDAHYKADTTFRIPADTQPGIYYLFFRTDSGGFLSEPDTVNNVLYRMVSVVPPGETKGLTAFFANSAQVTEELISRSAFLNDGIISGDTAGTVHLDTFEQVAINSGSFKDSGYFQGTWKAQLDGTWYEGTVRGVRYGVDADRTIRLKGVLSGSIISGIMEGTLSETSPGSEQYDGFAAQWRLCPFGDRAKPAVLQVKGFLNYQSSETYPAAIVDILQTGVSGTTLGHYNETITTVLTQVRITGGDNPFIKQGFSILSYSVGGGEGEGWTQDMEITAGRRAMAGYLTGPCAGIVDGLLDETRNPRELQLSIKRLDLGLSPEPDLKVNVRAAQRVSPGQKVDYIIQYRNDGLKNATKAIIYNYLDLLVSYNSSSADSYYDPYSHQVSWDLGAVPPRTGGYLTVRGEVAWGLPGDLPLENRVYIRDIVLHSTDENGFATGIQTNSDNENDMQNYREFASLNDAKLFVLYDRTMSITGIMEVYLASKNVRTARNGVGRVDDAQTIPGPLLSGHRPIWGMFSGGATSAVNQARNGEISGDILYLIAPQAVAQEDVRSAKAAFGKVVVCQGDDLLPDVYEWFMGSYAGSDKRLDKEEILRKAAESNPPDIYSAYLLQRVEKIEGKTFNSLRIYSLGPNNKMEITWSDSSTTELLVTHAIRAEDGIEVITVPGIHHDEWIPVLIEFKKKYGRLPMASDEARLITERTEYRKKKSAKSEHSIAQARDPNELFVSPEGEVGTGARLTYTINYENEGEGIAYGVYVTDTLAPTLDASTLVINNAGIYDPKARTISWFIGELQSKQKGSVTFSVNVKADAPDKTEVLNSAIVYFPSVPETTPTNGTVNKVVIVTDTALPITTASVSPASNPAGWHNNDVTVVLTAADDEGGSGVKELHYMATGMQCERVIAGNAAQLDIVSEGITTVAYYAVDNAGHVEPLKSIEVRLDKTLPSIVGEKMPPANQAGWNNQDVRVSFNASDVLSGIATVTAPHEVTTEEKAQYIGGEALDKADNKATTSVIVNLDKTAPVLMLSLDQQKVPIPCIRGTERFFLPSFYRLTLTASDLLSGITLMKKGLVVPDITAYKTRLVRAKIVSVLIDEKNKSIAIASPDPGAVLNQLQKGLFEIGNNQIMHLNGSARSTLWTIVQAGDFLKIRAPVIRFTGIATDYAGNTAVKNLSYVRNKISLPVYLKSLIMSKELSAEEITDLLEGVFVDTDIAKALQKNYGVRY